MGTKRTCERCGRQFISHGSLLCSGCERATHQQAAQKAARERRQQATRAGAAGPPAGSEGAGTPSADCAPAQTETLGSVRLLGGLSPRILPLAAATILSRSSGNGSFGPTALRDRLRRVA
jgi:hypothetical protein